MKGGIFYEIKNKGFWSENWWSKKRSLKKNRPYNITLEGFK